MADAKVDAGLGPDDRITLAVLGNMVVDVKEMIQSYHNEDCEWRDKVDGRLIALEQWKAMSTQRWEDNAKAHQVMYTVISALIMAAIILSVYLSAHLGVPVVVK